MLQFLKKLNLCIKLGPETVHWVFTPKFICDHLWSLQITITSSVKSVSGVSLSRNATSIKYPYFLTIILSTLINCKCVKTFSACRVNDHVFQSITIGKIRFSLFVCLSVRAFQTRKIGVFNFSFPNSWPTQR